MKFALGRIPEDNQYIIDLTTTKIKAQFIWKIRFPGRNLTYISARSRTRSGTPGRMVNLYRSF